MYNGERIVSVFNKTGYVLDENEVDLYLTLNTKINSKWIKNLNITKEVVKVLKENMGNKVLDTGLGNDFLSLTPKAKINK